MTLTLTIFTLSMILTTVIVKIKTVNNLKRRRLQKKLLTRLNINVLNVAKFLRQYQVFVVM